MSRNVPVVSRRIRFNQPRPVGIGQDLVDAGDKQHAALLHVGVDLFPDRGLGLAPRLRGGRAPDHRVGLRQNGIPDVRGHVRIGTAGHVDDIQTLQDRRLDVDAHEIACRPPARRPPRRGRSRSPAPRCPRRRDRHRHGCTRSAAPASPSPSRARTLVPAVHSQECSCPTRIRREWPPLASGRSCRQAELQTSSRTRSFSSLLAPIPDRRDWASIIAFVLVSASCAMRARSSSSRSSACPAMARSVVR